MKTITTNNRTLLFVEVPEKASKSQVIAEISEHLKGGKIFVATTDKISEKLAKLFVGKGSVGYAHYGTHVRHSNSPLISAMLSTGASVETCYTTALESFATLLQHHSITGRHAIIEVL